MSTVFSASDSAAVRKPSSDRVYWILCIFALTTSFAEYWLLNYSAFPLFDSVFIWTREASAIAGGLVLTTVAFVSYWRPRLFGSKRFFTAALASMLVGVALVLTGLALQIPLVLVAGASLVTMGTGLSNMVIGIGCIKLGMHKIGITVAVSYALAYCCRSLFAVLPTEVNLGLFCVLPLVSVVLMARFARPIFEQMCDGISPAQAAVTTPSSFLPFGNQIFIALLIFRFIYGFTLTFGEVDRIPLLAMGALVPLGLLAVFVVISRKDLSPDGLFQLSILCSVAGFLMLSIEHVQGSVTSILLSCGTGFFEILMFYVLIALGSKNTLNALPMLAWGSAMASWGTLLGANFGRFTNGQATDLASFSIISSIMVFGIVVYVVLVRKSFSFASTINAVTPLVPLVPARTIEGAPASLEERCASIGKARGLTEREQEIFEYLARGRNVRFIQEALVVSYNTVKTHVSHIYAKLDVHSHQELINLVESLIEKV